MTLYKGLILFLLTLCGGWAIEYNNTEERRFRSLGTSISETRPGYSIECYVCNSHNDTECSSAIPPERFKVPCRADKNETMCRKIKQVIDFEVNGLPPDSRIIRSCGWFNKSLSNHCYQRSGFGGRQEVCACNDRDLCNASNTLIVSYTFVLAFYAVLKICQH